jgi:hypothetical protein
MFQFKQINLKQQMSPNMDLVKGILSGFHTARKMNGRIIFQYVKGHQDNKKDTLTPAEVLNIHADKFATEDLKKAVVKDIKLSTDNAM